VTYSVARLSAMAERLVISVSKCILKIQEKKINLLPWRQCLAQQWYGGSSVIRIGGVNAVRPHTTVIDYFLIHDLLFLPISTIESAVGKRLITHWLVHAWVDTSSHIRLDFKREINTTTTVMN